MTEPNFIDFIVACNTEIKTRLGVDIQLDRADEFRRSPKFADKVVSRERFLLAVQTLAKTVPPEKRTVFDAEEHEISPAHFVDLLITCDLHDGDREHLARCPVCTQGILDLSNIFYSILEGADPIAALERLEKSVLSLPESFFEGLADLKDEMSQHRKRDSLINNWAMLMLDPEYLTSAYRGIDGLQPEQAKELLSTVCTFVGNRTEKPTPDDFLQIVITIRGLVEIGPK